MRQVGGIWIAVIVLITGGLCVDTNAMEEYTVTAGNERLHFTARPDLGYVVKAHQNPAAIKAMDKSLREHGADDIRPVKGLGRKGVSVVHRQGLASENDKAIADLRTRKGIAYIAPLFSSNGETIAIIPEIVVRVKSADNGKQLEGVCGELGLTIKKRMEFTECEYLLEVGGHNADAVFAAIDRLEQASFIEWACPNVAFEPKLCGQFIPNDEYFPNQWHLNNTGQSSGTPDADINAAEAWEFTAGDPNIIIGVPDTGIDTNHPDLKDCIVPGYDFLDDDDDPMDDLGHGTACAGLLAATANNVVGVAGVAYNCRIMPIRFENAAGDLPTDADIATAFRWMANNGADVITNSWGWGYAVPITHSAIIDVTKAGGIGRDGKGCVVIGGAGNGGTSSVIYIARYPEVIAVGATDHNDNLCWYSSYGPDVDIVAPGGGGIETYDPDLFALSPGLLWTTDITGPTGWSTRNTDPTILDYTGKFAGTSASCPVAAGVAALILSVDPNLTNLEVQSILEQSASDLGEPGWDEQYGHGRVDARAALEIVLRTRADDS